MNQGQMQTIIDVIAGMQLAIIHLANVIVRQDPSMKEALATTFDESADSAQTPLMALPLRQIADGLRLSTTAEAGQTLQDLLERLSRGSEPPPSAAG